MLKRTKTAPSLISARRDVEEALLRKIAKKHKVDPSQLKLALEEEEEEEEEEGIPEEMAELLEMAKRRDKEVLENRGIIIIDSVITKKTLARATRRLFVLHFDEEFTDDIQLILNSPGGFCDAGWAFIDTMRFIKNRVITVTTGEICSMATSIFIAGDERVMSPNSVAMIHQFRAGTEGTYGDLLANRKFEDMEAVRQIKHLVKYSKYTTEADVKKHLLKDHDNWLSPAEMKKHGLCDKISRERKYK